MSQAGFNQTLMTIDNHNPYGVKCPPFLGSGILQNIRIKHYTEII
jgi:hypothetical protein